MCIRDRSYLTLDGTALLDMTPSGSGGLFDGQLKFGRSFYDPELGVKFIPLARTGTTPESVDILVKHVHYLAASTQLNDGAADFSVNITEPGQYSVWCRTVAASRGLGMIVDGQVVTSASLETTSNTNWVW